MDEWQALANAIIEQAAKDYMTAIRRLKRERTGAAAMKEAMEIEKFFHSEWYKTLTSIDGDYMIDRLRREAVK